MTKIYFYPKKNPRDAISPSPYMPCFEEALTKNYAVVNQNLIKNGIFEFFKYLFRADLFLYSFIENVVQFRFGKLQAIYFFFFFWCTKLLGKKTLWVMHNKYSHDRKKNKWTDFMFSLMVKHSNLILTHSEAGIEYIQEKYPSYAKKVKFIIHPIPPHFPFVEKAEKKYDFLIWGTISPYKGHLEFLEYLEKNGALGKYKILIIGRYSNQEYGKKLRQYLSDNIQLDDKFYELEEIAHFAHQSRFVLFTHKPTSVLSSGALMDSIRMGAKIIGPNHGAFKDLKDYSFVNTYEHFDQIHNIYESNREIAAPLSEMKVFCKDNSWHAFADKITSHIDGIMKND